MASQIPTIDDLNAFETRIFAKIDEINEKIKPPKKWVKASVVYERYGYSPNKLKKLRRNGEINYKLVGGTYMYDIAKFDEN